jgi:hypothetical protein
MPTDEAREAAAGRPAAGLFAHLISQAAQLDARRRELAADNETLAGLLLDIEQTTFRQVYDQVQEGREAWSSPSRSSSSDASWPMGSSSFSQLSPPRVERRVSVLRRPSGTQLGKWMRSLIKRASAWKKWLGGDGPANGASETASAPGGAGKAAQQSAGPVVQGEIVE